MKRIIAFFFLLPISNHLLGQLNETDSTITLPFPWKENDQVQYIIYKKNELIDTHNDTLLLDEQTFYVRLTLFHQEDTLNYFAWDLFVLNKIKYESGDSTPIDYLYTLPYVTNLKGSFLSYIEPLDSIMLKFEKYRPYVFMKQLQSNGSLIDQPIKLTEWYKTGILSNELFIVHNFYGTEYILNKKSSKISLGFTPWLIAFYNYDHDFEAYIQQDGSILFQTSYKKNMKVPVRKRTNNLLSAKDRKRDYKYAMQVKDFISGKYIYYPNGLLESFRIENVLENGNFKIKNTIVTELRTDI
ncbi:hypothetical protein [Gynurincola endophyticus]|uniref:hypothetical protein n=1 Tax=Gynurincola endophyticus TaxID=2479004 RepID=UPI000F8EC4AA|nr:hypothetical protein [Gynurincola endophyticus]